MADLIDIISFSKSQSQTRSGGGGSGSGGSYRIYQTKSIENATYADRLRTPRYIWGHKFDGSKDIDGDLLISNGKFEMYGPWKAGAYNQKVSYASFSPTASASGQSKWNWRRTDVELMRGNFTFCDEDDGIRMMMDRFGLHANRDMIIEAENELTIKADKINMDLKNGDIRANSGYFNNLYDNGTGAIYVGSPMILDEGLVIQGDLTVEDLYSQNVHNEFEITTKDLTVTGNAHFFNLVIDEVKHAGGQIILSAASFKIDDVITEGRTVDAGRNYGVAGDGRTDLQYQTIYLYQVCTDDDGQDIQNQFQPLDHIMCYTANVSEDSELDARSWWTLVWRTGHKQTHRVGGENKLCNVLEIVKKVKVHNSETNEDEWVDPYWGEVNVKAGDNAALLGSHNRDRRSAIVMAAYKSFDNNIQAPCIAQYENIHNWTLTGCATTYFAKNGNRIQGDLFVNGGQAVEDILEGLKHGYKTYLHNAWANSADGTVDFSKEPGEFEYMGLCSNFEPDDEDLGPEDYKWSKISDRTDKLVPARERLYLATDDTCYLDVAYMQDYFTSQDNTITVEIFTYAGTKTTRQVTDVSPDGLRSYTGIVQLNWSEVVQPGDRYCGATVYLKDATGEILDSHALYLTFDAGAILQVTDIIKARVTDAEGNINSLVITAKSLNERITDAEGSYNDLLITVDGLRAQIDQRQREQDGWLTKKFAAYDVTVEGMKAAIEEIDTNIADENWIVEKTHQLDVSVSGLESKVEQIEKVGYDDTEIRRRMSDLEVSIDGLEYGIVDQIVGCANILNGTGFGIMDKSEIDESWSGNFTCSEPSLSQGPDAEHGYANIDGTISQSLTGKLQPASWYTLQMRSTSPCTIQFDGSPADNTLKYFVCSQQSEDNCPADVAYNFSNASSICMPGNNDFSRYWITFKTKETLTESSSVTLKISGQCKLAMVKLEEGKFASTYDYSPRDREGMFKVTGDEAYIRIRDGLKESGINITSGEIQLKSDKTTIIGDIDVRQANNAGLVVYDAAEAAAVQLRGVSIGSLNDFQGNTYKSCNFTTHGSVNSWNLTTERLLISNVEAGTEFSLGNFTVSVAAGTGSELTNIEYPTVQTPDITVRFYRDGVLVSTMDVRLQKNNSQQGYYVNSKVMSWTTQVGGTFEVEFVFDWPGEMGSDKHMYAVGQGTFSFQAEQCTFLGSDGMYSGNPEQFLWAGPEGVVVRQHNRAFKIDRNGVYIGSAGGQVSGDAVLFKNFQWQSVFNCKPMKRSSAMTQQVLTVQPISASKNCIKLDYTFEGYLNVDLGGGASGTDEIWILLPDSTYTDESGNTFSLPAGWNVTIINGMYGNTRGNLYVSTEKLTGNYDGGRNVIFDSNRNGNRYCDLNGVQSSDTYLWDGFVWRSMHDTQ